MTSPLQDAVSRYIDAQGDGDGVFRTPIDGLVLLRSSVALTPHHIIYRPALCVVVQGAKQVMFGDQVFDYAAMQFLVISVELPGLGRVTRASAAEPCLVIILEFDVGAMRAVLEQLDTVPRSDGGHGLGVFVGDLEGALADCVLRLLRLLETPKAIPVLVPAVMREIGYWLLTGAHGDMISRLAMPNSATQRVTDAIHVLREDFVRPMRIGQLAAAARMSPSSFHQHFKALTAMTPLQYQKQLRLLEARRLMAAGEANATSAAYQVGYESASQFSREYARMFGAPPRRDVTGMKALS